MTYQCTKCGVEFQANPNAKRIYCSRKCYASTLVIHGHARKRKHRTGTYISWDSMIGRCTRLNNPYYSKYVGRGITICARWMSFECFLSDMGTRPDGTTLDRFPDNDGNYEPGNCRWATKTQQQNNRCTNVVVEYNGERHTVTEWARHLGLPVDRLRSRIASGWTPERAFTVPIGGL